MKIQIFASGLTVVTPILELKWHLPPIDQFDRVHKPLGLFVQKITFFSRQDLLLTRKIREIVAN